MGVASYGPVDTSAPSASAPAAAAATSRAWGVVSWASAVNLNREIRGRGGNGGGGVLPGEDVVMVVEGLFHGKMW